MKILRTLVPILVVAVLYVGVAPAVAVAAPVPSSTGSETNGASREADLERIERALEDENVQEGLRQAGTNPDELQSILPRMTDHDVHLLAERMDEVKAGGDSIVTLLVVIILVLLIIYLVKRV